MTKQEKISILSFLLLFSFLIGGAFVFAERCWQYETYTEWWGDYGGLDKYVADTEEEAVARGLSVPLYEKDKTECVHYETIYNHLID